MGWLFVRWVVAGRGHGLYVCISRCESSDSDLACRGRSSLLCVGSSQPAVVDTFKGQMDTQGWGDLRSHHTHYRFDLYCDAMLGQESVRKV